jgi:hypothetical protein
LIDVRRLAQVPVRNWRVLLLCWWCASAFGAALPGPHRAYLARDSGDGSPGFQAIASFSCDDTVYAVAELANLRQGKHELLALWVDPGGRTRERTPLAFQARLASERVWVWLRLTRPAGASAISFLDPAAGMSEFIGQWAVTLTLDGARLDTLQFKVLC